MFQRWLKLNSDDLGEETKAGMQRELAQVIKVNARPLTILLDKKVNWSPQRLLGGLPERDVEGIISQMSSSMAIN